MEFDWLASDLEHRREVKEFLAELAGERGLLDDPIIVDKLGEARGFFNGLLEVDRSFPGLQAASRSALGAQPGGRSGR